MDSKTAKEGLETLAMAIADLLEAGLDQAAIDPGAAPAYAPVAASLEALADDLGVLAAAMSVITRRAAHS